MEWFWIVTTYVVVAWFTSAVSCLMNQQHVLLLASIFFAPIGIIHGTGIWFGAKW